MKFYDNYLKWNKWINKFSTEKETIGTKNLIVHSNIPYSYTMVKYFKTTDIYIKFISINIGINIHILCIIKI
ncbi:hypothetical protein I3900191A7_19190 [Clostridium baratii]